jgi:hypothetical protein
MAMTKRFAWWGGGNVFIDHLNQNSNQLLLFEFWRHEFRTDEATEAFSPLSWYLLRPKAKGAGYELRQIPDDKNFNLTPLDLQDIYIRETQKTTTEEYWGYRPKEETTTYPYPLLRKVVLKKDASGFIRTDVDIAHHEAFLGIGYFDLRDIDGDGLDEIIVVEQTGKVTVSSVEEDEVGFTNVKDYIRILKWDGIKYQTMWVSPPYTKRGTKFLVEDIKKTGNKQLVVFTTDGTIQIWERL